MTGNEASSLSAPNLFQASHARWLNDAPFHARVERLVEAAAQVGIWEPSEDGAQGRARALVGFALHVEDTFGSVDSYVSPS